MKLTMHYDMSDLDDKEAFNHANKALDYHNVLWDLSQDLRKVYKYSEDEEEVKYAEKYRALLFEICERYNVEI